MNIYILDEIKKYSSKLAFNLACETGNVEEVKKYLNEKYDCTIDDNRAIILASINGHFEIVQELLKAGADCTACENEAIIGASENGHLEVVKLLLENLASEKGYNKIAKVFFDDGWHYNSRLNADEIGGLIQFTKEDGNNFKLVKKIEDAKSEKQETKKSCNCPSCTSTSTSDNYIIKEPDLIIKDTLNNNWKKDGNGKLEYVLCIPCLNLYNVEVVVSSITLNNHNIHISGTKNSHNYKDSFSYRINVRDIDIKSVAATIKGEVLTISAEEYKPNNSVFNVKINIIN